MGLPEGEEENQELKTYLKEQIKAPEKLQLNDEEIANISEA